MHNTERGYKKTTVVIISVLQQKRDLKILLKEKDISCEFINVNTKYKLYNNYIWVILYNFVTSNDILGVLYKIDFIKQNR